MKTISKILQEIHSSDRKSPCEVDLDEIGTAKVVAAKNPFINGFAVVVVSSIGNRYGVTGFKTLPSKSALASAIDSAKSYAITYGIA
jgi:hypothetical protein